VGRISDRSRRGGVPGGHEEDSHGLAGEDRLRPVSARAAVGPRRGAGGPRPGVVAVAGPARADGRAADRHQAGTGGSAGGQYLRSRVELRFYPELWELRSRL
jgi:hypothetical protein